MGVALYIVEERKLPGIETHVNGKALGRSKSLNKLARQAGVRRLMEFFSQDPEEAAAFIEDEGGEVPTGGFPAEQWFSCHEGSVTVRGLLTHLAANPTAARDAVAITEDLREFESILAKLAEAGVRWHLAIDF